MNWLDLADFASQQSTVFYGAALAVAAGLTLLVAAAVQQGRRLFARLSREKQQSEKSMATENISRHRKISLGQKIDQTDEPVYAVPSAMAPVEPETASTHDRQIRLDALTTRLEELASQLEEMQGDMVADSHFQKAFSGLKPGSDGVEYLCRKETF